MNSFSIEPNSFRDPNGFIFYSNGKLYRQINKSYQKNYEHLIESGLYDKLLDEHLLIPHTESNISSPVPSIAFKIIEPEFIPFISYPYEWSFSQLKDAAQTTMKIQKISMEFEMTLKDASAYNIQFFNGKPIFSDTISFELYKDGQPWYPYKQFCQHFLAPLALMKYTDIRLSNLLKTSIDGIPLDLASKLLPFSTKTSFSLLSHIHAHAKSQKFYEGKQAKIKNKKLPRNSFNGIIESVTGAIKKINWTPSGTEWGDYYHDTNYTDESFQEKKNLILEFLKRIKPSIVWDLGSNTGIFSRLASDNGILTISLDVDPSAVEKNYLESKKNHETNLLPLLMDLTNPSPNLGWDNNERKSIFSRTSNDTVMALALIHHLAISNNVPLGRLSEFFSKICKNLIIEFIPKDDSQVQRLLSTREDVFPNYNIDTFKKEFESFFKIIDFKEIKGSKRGLFLLKRL
jgi:ribosomal protein L11 methylase PrmA